MRTYTRKRVVLVLRYAATFVLAVLGWVLFATRVIVDNLGRVQAVSGASETWTAMVIVADLLPGWVWLSVGAIALAAFLYLIVKDAGSGTVAIEKAWEWRDEFMQSQEQAERDRAAALERAEQERFQRMEQFESVSRSREGVNSMLREEMGVLRESVDALRKKLDEIHTLTANDRKMLDTYVVDLNGLQRHIGSMITVEAKDRVDRFGNELRDALSPRLSAIESRLERIDASRFEADEPQPPQDTGSETQP